jgi:N4-(beta-N-acetylglucosaminyl)-L-asparaginase
MDEKANIGAVLCLEHIVHPISVARKVMEETPHVMLSGQGALDFALSKGFPKTNLLTPESEKEWKDWLKTEEYKPKVNIENHDTIGMIGLDAAGKLAGSCTTSGLAYKMHGRVGDSPIIGAGLFVDDEVGAATATGLGESIIRICGSFLIVELMRQGRSPQEACEEAVRRLVAKNKNIKDIQAGFLAINKEGEVGAFAVHPGFNYALATESGNVLVDAGSQFKP